MVDFWDHLLPLLGQKRASLIVPTAELVSLDFACGAAAGAGTPPLHGRADRRGDRARSREQVPALAPPPLASIVRFVTGLAASFAMLGWVARLRNMREWSPLAGALSGRIVIVSPAIANGLFQWWMIGRHIIHGLRPVF